MGSREWVVLVKSAGGFRQIGPLETRDVLEKIQTGDVRYDDHVWKPGYAAWTPVRRVEALAPPAPAHDEPVALDAQEPDTNFDVDLNNIVRQVRLPLDVSIADVAETDGRDYVSLREFSAGPAASANIEAVKGLQLFEKDGSPVEFIEEPTLTATRKLHYRLKRPTLEWRRPAALAAVFAVITIGALIARESTQFREEPFYFTTAARDAAKSKPADFEAAIAPANETGAGTAPAVAADSAQQSTPDAPAGPSASELTQQRGELAVLAERLASKLKTFEDSRKHLMADHDSLKLYIDDWQNSLQERELIPLHAENFHSAYDPSLTWVARKLQDILRQMIAQTNDLRLGHGEGPFALESDLLNIIQFLKD
ncbi:MAG TPA: DUF4339 domain-containing protein [Bdellovibrionales bacterium]|nr:DUF4339 domain-containing protein [Bdellovibrionales bacterium]